MIPFLDAGEITRLLSPEEAVAVVEAALRGGLDPAAGVARSTVPLPAGELLLMPAWSAAHAGVKLAAVAPGNPALGLPRINAVYVLFDGTTLLPVALFDGTALTTLRTPAVSVAAVRAALGPGPLRVVVFGAGPQGTGHVATLAAVAELSTVDVVVRSPDAVDRAAPVAAGGPPARVLRAGSVEVPEALRAADVVVCATTARTPLFDSALLAERAVVLAVGSHEPDAREVDAAFCRRATVVVEDVATALRECGDVVLAIGEGALSPDRLVPMRDVVRGTATLSGGPLLFKGSGMAWQDLVVAEAVLARST
ncbi:ornithine cyclodeaminase family protein [Dactylosporangium fulvum]|uniref:Ornithine cyclodeaminase family protein n=1 Tax=Dactylosporangium fulvum TaxID=53359 RepID=A0ABY5W6H0_9ACTN|nr:ornithine cyclodeaminase family protein [Dactylosporangium fulvum]UWP85152.1 ornithine cyclodeaminase family protein [Dactylosporangium fulvum]